jgi:hypothetical protein
VNTPALLLGSLTIGYSVLASRAGTIAFPPEGTDAEILVCVQGGDVSLPDAPAGTRVVPVPGVGVGRSRNAVLAHATRRYLLFSDDDVALDLDGVAAGIRHLETTGRALALGRGVDTEGNARKRHPTAPRTLTLLNSGRAATYEMLVDREQVRARGVGFDERFGAGAALHLGDEYLFIADLLRAGLSADAVPLVFARHPVASSGARWGTSADSHARAVAINRVFGPWAPAARLAFAVKNRSKLGGTAALWRFVSNGTRPPIDRGATPAPPPLAVDTV